MKRYSITRRLVTTILMVEFVLAALATTVELVYLRSQELKAFDIMLRGRADSVFGAVQDLEDQADSVFLDKSVLDLPGRDVYQVREESGTVVGQSDNWVGLAGTPEQSRGSFQRVQVHGHDYRAVTLHLTRNIDPNAKGSGVAHKIVVVYAAPMRPIWHELGEEARLLALGNTVLLILTGVAVIILLRRGMAPLNALAEEAAGISAHSWTFQAPAEAYAARELFPLATALNLALKRLEYSFRQQQAFVSDAAHELKTAVAIVKSSLQLLAYKERSVAEYREGLELCLTDCGRLEDLVAKMLALASLEQSQPESMGGIRETTNLTMCVRQISEQVKPLAQLRGVAVEIAEDSVQLEVALAEPDCATLVMNLVVNAIQHSPAGSQIEIAVSEEGFSVQDRGEGIASEALPFVFDRFYREDRSRARNTGGAGLGLAICKAIVDAHHGRITIASRPGEGTLVTVVLPGGARSKPSSRALSASFVQH